MQYSSILSHRTYKTTERTESSPRDLSKQCNRVSWNSGTCWQLVECQGSLMLDEKIWQVTLQGGSCKDGVTRD